MQQEERLLVREAANWFAQMHGPEADQNEPEFRAWLAKSEAHRNAYSQVSEAFSLGKNLTGDNARDPIRPHSEPKVHKRTAFATAAALVIAFGGASIAVERYGVSQAGRGPAIVTADHFTTSSGKIQTVRLSDGSTIILDAGAELTTLLGADRRDLWLVQGRARFDVAHERRPFVVHAGGGTVTAHGTLFDVRVEGGATSVRLLRGAIDVDLPARGHEPPESRHVSPGEAVSFKLDRGIATITTAQSEAIVQPTWPESLLEFDRVRVADVIAETNRYSSGHLIVVSPEIADLRVSGTFRVGDPDRLAQHIASLLDVQVSHQPNGDIALSKPAR